LSFSASFSEFCFGECFESAFERIALGSEVLVFDFELRHSRVGFAFGGFDLAVA